MKPPKHIPKPVRKAGGARATKLSDQMASPTVELAASQAAHFDNYSVEQFAYAMRIKLAVKRNEGRGGWQDKEFCSGDFLSQLLRDHVEKGDPVDVANFCMMLHQRGEKISPVPSPIAECAECHGTGEVFGHADDCHDDLCALNGDEHSCSGKVEPCGCTSPQTRETGIED